MSSFLALPSRLEPAKLIHADEAAGLLRAAMALARIAARVLGAVVFAGVMWLLLAAPGLLDGGGSTMAHAPGGTAARHASR